LKVYSCSAVARALYHTNKGSQEIRSEADGLQRLRTTGSEGYPSFHPKIDMLSRNILKMFSLFPNSRSRSHPINHARTHASRNPRNNQQPFLFTHLANCCWQQVAADR
jgi:hypothetical protein